MAQSSSRSYSSKSSGPSSSGKSSGSQSPPSGGKKKKNPSPPNEQPGVVEPQPEDKQSLPQEKKAYAPQEPAQIVMEAKAPTKDIGAKEQELKRKPSKEDSGQQVPPRLFVGHLTRNVTEGHLKEIFSTWGQVKQADVSMDRVVNLPRGYAYVEFERREDAETALAYMDGGQIDGNIIQVKFVHVPRKKAPSPIPSRQPRSPLRDATQPQFRERDTDHDQRGWRRRSPPHRYRSPPGGRRKSRSPVYRRRSNSPRRRSPPGRRVSPRRYPPVPRRRSPPRRFARPRGPPSPARRRRSPSPPRARRRSPIPKPSHRRRPSRGRSPQRNRKPNRPSSSSRSSYSSSSRSRSSSGRSSSSSSQSSHSKARSESPTRP